MDRQDDDPNMVNNSSIALLQERFRQLEKVKERREGKELLKLFSTESQGSNSSNVQFLQPSESSSSSLQTRFMAPHRQTHQDSLSLGLNLVTKQADHHAMRAPKSSSNLWPDDGTATSSASRNFENSDVDTSLHL